MAPTDYKRDTPEYKLRPTQMPTFWSNLPARTWQLIMRRRDDRNDKTYFRSERVFAMNGQWYFGAREGDHGPFRTPDLARAALARFLNEKVELDRFQKSREQVVSKPKLPLSERLKIADVPVTRAVDAPELLI
jgi:hypothetical protein